MEIEGNTEDLAKRIVELESQCGQLKEQVMKLTCKEETMKNKYLKVKRVYGETRDKFDSEESRWRENSRQLTVQKRKLEIDLKAAVCKNTCSDDAVKKRRVAEAEVEGLKSRLEERDYRITNLLGKNGVLEGKNSSLERVMAMEAQKQKVGEQKNLELSQKLQVLEQMMAVEAKNHKLGEQKTMELNEKIRVFEREKKELVAEVSKLQKEKSDEAERNLNLNKAIEVEKKRLKEIEGKTFELVKRIGALERAKKAMQENVSKLNREKSEKVKEILNEKRAFEEESKEEVLVLVKRIESLEEEKRGMEAEVHRATMEKIAAEAEKRALEEESKKMVAVLTKRNESLEEEKRETEAKVSRAYKERNTEMERILKEKMALKEKGEKMSSERDEVIQVLQQDIETLEARNKELEREKIRLVLKREEDDELYHQSQGRSLNEMSTKRSKRIEALKEKGMKREMPVEAEVGVEAQLSRYESQKRRDWNTFQKYLRTESRS